MEIIRNGSRPSGQGAADSAVGGAQVHFASVADEFLVPQSTDWRSASNSPCDVSAPDRLGRSGRRTAQAV